MGVPFVPPITGQFIKGSDETGAQRVEVNVAHQFQKVRFFLAENRLVTILKEMSVTLVTAVEANGVAGQQAPHDGCHRYPAGLKENVAMIWNKCPGKAAG